MAGRDGERVTEGLMRRRVADVTLSAVTDYTLLPDDLPQPGDDGAADHLPGRQMPAIVLPTTSGSAVDLAALGSGRNARLHLPAHRTAGPGAADWLGRDPRRPRLLDSRRAISATTSVT